MFEPVIRYRMLKRLGAGGMGEVFLAEDRSLERRVAIKFVSRWLQDDPVAHERLKREAKAAAAPRREAPPTRDRAVAPDPSVRRGDRNRATR